MTHQNANESTDLKKKRGRPPMYATDEDRKKAKREWVAKWNEEHKEKRQQSVNKYNKSQKCKDSQKKYYQKRKKVKTI